MSALYQMQYRGVAGAGHGAIYIGRNKIVGVDITGARYDGAFVIEGVHLKGSAVLTSAGATLVTGLPVPAGSKIQITFDLGPDFGNGQYHSISVGSARVDVAFSKVGDIP